MRIVSREVTALIYVTTSSWISYGMLRNGYLSEMFSAPFILGLACRYQCYGDLGREADLRLSLFPGGAELVGFMTSAFALMYAGPIDRS